MGELQTIEKGGALAPVAPEQPQSLLPAIIAAASNPAVDVAKLDAIMKMQFQLEEREAKRSFIAAFARLSKDLPQVEKKGTIDLGGSTIAFARWEDMDDAIRPLLAREGFTLSFDTVERQGGGVTITATLMHEDGHMRTASVPLALDVHKARNNLQAMGSTISYGKRYATEILLNLTRKGQDDDGQKGGMSFLTPEQVNELRGMLDETPEAWHPTFFNMMGVAKLEDIAQGGYAPARGILQAKKNQKAKS